MENDLTALTAQEIAMYLEHLGVVSKIKNLKGGDVTKYSGLSFGTPTKASFQLTEDGVLNADFDFSSSTWNYDNDNVVRENVNLDTVKDGSIESWRWMQGNMSRDFDRKLDMSMIDVDRLKAILGEKYGIGFDMNYDEKVYSETKIDGSDDMVSKSRIVYFVIDSHVRVAGRPKVLNQDSSFGL